MPKSKSGGLFESHLKTTMNSSAPSSSSSINRSVPFIGKSSDGTGDILLLDRFELSLAEVENRPAVVERIARALDLSFLGHVVSVGEFELLLSEQYAAASEFVYGHPFWEAIRRGSKTALFAYLLETKHYLAAAASRMSPSIAPGIGLSPLTLLLSQHLLEEWNHAGYFSEALALVGCPPALTNSARPIPATLEWIHATRAIGYKSGLSAAACSGFMEYSSTETQAVRSWHLMLVEQGLLPAAANASIAGHLEADLSFGHAGNWKRAIAIHGPVSPSSAADVLNDIATIAEAIYRWLSALLHGCSASIVRGMQILAEEYPFMVSVPPRSVYDVALFDGLPVWPSALMDSVNSGHALEGESARTMSALTYAFGHWDMHDIEHPLASSLARNIRLLSPPGHIDPVNAESLEATVTAWLRSIDGHSLWDSMVEKPTEGLIAGYILENYHYLASAAGHIGAAISSCTNASIRTQLIEHLSDELQHCDLLEAKLTAVVGLSSARHMRPLSTTVAFVGFLEAVARQDWKAYILVSTFLQKSLSECRPSRRHSRFYQAVVDRNSRCGSLLDAIWFHDDLDLDLGHDDRCLRRLRGLVNEEAVSRESLKHAAIAPALAWSFLDGIASHYGNGRAALMQRMAWRAC